MWPWWVRIPIEDFIYWCNPDGHDDPYDHGDHDNPEDHDNHDDPDDHDNPDEETL